MVHCIGDLLNQRYSILGILGEGGTGKTYRAQDLQKNQQVAIKTLSLQKAGDWKVVELFEREAKILAQIDYPNIPRYLDYFVVESDRDRAFYLVQELAPGKSLFEWVQDGWHATEAEVKEIARQVLDILDYLHSLNPPVIHRDLKPHNLIRSEDGKIYLVDFGAVGHTYHNTLMRGSTVVGTYGYMAPEQFRGQAVPATDLYGLGATLLFLLTQRSPAELPTQKLKIEFRSRINLSDFFAQWLEKLLEPAIKDRFVSAREAILSLNRQPSFKYPSLKISLVLGGVSLLILGAFLTLENHKYALMNKLGLTDSVYYAMQKKEIDINEYLKRGGNINAKGTSGRNLIYYAIRSNDLNTVKTLVSQGVDLEVVDADGKTPLHEAAENSSDIFAYLLSLDRINLNARDREGKTAIEYVKAEAIAETLAAYFKKKLVISQEKKNDLINRLCKHSLEKDWLELALQIKNNFSNSVTVTLDEIALKALGKDDSKIFPTLIAQNKKLSPYFFKQMSFYDLARFIYLTKIIEFIPNANVSDLDGRTFIGFLCHKAEKNDLVIKQIHKLIKTGIDVNQINSEGAPVLLDCMGGNDFVEIEKKEEIAIALIKAGANVNLTDKDGSSALHFVVWSYTNNLVQMILQKGADPNAKNKQGRTPLYGAVFNENLEVVKTLIAAGADINNKDNEGVTPLHEAVEEEGLVNVVKILIAAGADINSKDNEGRTPLDRFNESSSHRDDYFEMAELLINAGAKGEKNDNN